MRKIQKDIYNAGVFDRKIDLFEGQYRVPKGISYNSYVILDEKIAVFDSVDKNFGDGWLNNLDKILKEELPDYLIVLHMEPDHSANILNFIKKYPDTVVVGNSKTFVMLNQLFGEDFEQNRLVVADGDSLSLGKHCLKFIFAPMVHWPEVMMAYDVNFNTLYSADAFGKFGNLKSGEDWVEEARRYYYGIVGKYGVQVKSVLNKLNGYDIQNIYPLHGPVLTKNISDYIGYYKKWSSYEYEKKGILIVYTSVYGNTAKAAKLLENDLKIRNIKNLAIYDLARSDIYECIAKAFEYSHIVLASTTYNATVFPVMNFFLDGLLERNFQNRTVGIIENGSWAPAVKKSIITKLENCKNLQYTENNVKINMALNLDSVKQISALADELSENLAVK